MSSANAKPIMDSLEKQFKSRPLNLPVNFRFKGVNTQQINQYNAAFRTLSKTISQLGNASAKTSINLAMLNSRLRQVGASLHSFGQSSTNVRNFQTSVSSLGKGIDNVGKKSKRAGREVISFAESIGISVRRLSSFGVAASVIATTGIAIRRATMDALEFDRELVRLKQVGEKSEAGIAQIEKTITKLGTSLGVSSKDMVGAAVTLRQAGLSAKDTSKALEVLGKTSLSASFENIKSTTEGIIAVLNQFGGSADDLERKFDAISKVSADYAVESTDLVEAIKRTGGAFKAAGGNLNELLAMFTTIRSTTRESAESIATGMRTILARLQDPAIAQKLRSIGVEVYDLKGQFVGPLEAVNRLSAALSKIPQGDYRASSILKDIGGLRQLSRVIPLVYRPDLTQQALQSAESGMGKLSEDARIAQEALLTQLAKIKEGFLDLFRVISSDSSVRMVLNGIIASVQTLTEAMRQLKPLVPIFLAFATVGVGKYVLGHLGQFRRGVVAPVSGYAKGGFVSGPPGHDKVPAMLTRGEYVVPAEQAKHLARGGRIDILQAALDKAGIDLQARKFVRGVHFTNNRRGSPAASGWFQRGSGLIGVHYKEDVPTLMHEFGHAIDFNIGSNIQYPKYGSEFNPSHNYTVASAFRKNLSPDYKQYKYFTSTDPESFAEAFKLYTGRKLGIKSPHGMNKPMSDEALDFIGNVFERGIFPRLRENQPTQFKKHPEHFSNYAKSFKEPLDLFANTFSSKGFSTGGKINLTKAFANLGKSSFHPELRSLFKPKGTDVVPAMLTPGEFVITARAAKTFGYDRLRRINQLGGFSNIESQYGYKNLGEHLMMERLELTKRLYQMRGNYRLRKQGNWEKALKKNQLGHMIDLIDEHLGKPYTYAHLLPSDSTAKTGTYVQKFARGGLVYMSDGDEVFDFANGQRKVKKIPDKNQYTKKEHGVIKFAKTPERADVPFNQPMIPVGAGDYQTLPVGGVQKNVVPPFKPENFQSKPAYIPPLKPHEDPAFLAEQQRLAEQYHNQHLREQVTFTGSMSRQGSTQAYLQKKRQEQLARVSRVATSTSPMGDLRLNDVAAQEMIKRMQQRTAKENRDKALQSFEEKQKSLTSPYPLSDNATQSIGLHQLTTIAGKRPIASVAGLFGPTASVVNPQNPPIRPQEYPLEEPTHFPTGPVGPIINPQLEERVRRRQAREHFGYSRLSGMTQGPPPENLYHYQSVNTEGRHIGTLSVRANTVEGAKKLLQQQGQFVTAIKQVDNTFTNRFFPSLSKWLTNTTKGLDKAKAQAAHMDPALRAQMKEARFGKMQAGLFAASVAIPALTETLGGENTPQKGGSHFKAGTTGGLTGAIAGASVGSTFGGWGAAVGALIGGITGIVTSLRGFDDQLKEIDLKKFGEDLRNIEVKNGQLTNSGRSGISNLIGQGIQAGLVEQKHTLWERTKTLVGMGTNHRVGKYEALNSMPEEQRNALSDSIRALFEAEANKNPGQSYKQIIDKLGNFKVKNVEFGAGEILGLNKKNTEELQKNIQAQIKAFNMQEKMNSLLGQLNQELGLTAAQLEAFSTSLETSGQQYELRSQYSQIGSAPLRGQIAALPANVGLNNLGGPGTIPGELHSFAKTGGGYDQAKQALLQIVQNASQMKLGNMTDEEASIHTGEQAANAFRSPINKKGEKIGGAYNEQIAEMAQHVIGNTSKLQNVVRDRGAAAVVDQILQPFQDIKKTGAESQQKFAGVYAQEQQRKVELYNRQYELRQQSAAQTASESEAANQEYLRSKALKPDEVGLVQGRSRYIGGSNRANTIGRGRLMSQPEMIANAQLDLAKKTFNRQQGVFGAAGLSSNQIVGKYNAEEGKLNKLFVEREQVRKTGDMEALGKLDDQIYKTQDNMRNFATALKNAAENTSVLEAAQRKYEVAVGKFTADYESRKKDADVLAFGSREEKAQLAYKENVTQQALQLNPQQFSSLPDEIKKMVYERLQETQGMNRTFQQYDKYGRATGTTIDKNGDELLNQIRKPYLDQLTGQQRRGRFDPFTGNYYKSKYTQYYDNQSKYNPSNRLLNEAKEADTAVKAATNNKLEAQYQQIKLNEKDVNKQSTQGADNFQLYLKGINESIAQQMAATDRFLKGSADLVNALNGFKGEVNINRNGRVEVVVNTGGAMQAIQKELKEFHTEIMGQIAAEFKKMSKEQPLI